MIKINLLEGARARPEAKVKLEGPVSLPAFQAKVFGVALGSLAIVVSFFYWYWHRQINHLNDNLRVEQAEAVRLKGIEAENERYAKQLSEMERRIKTIEALESSRKGPVELMASLGATVNNTHGLYLLSVSTQENQLNLQGQSPTVDAIAAFIATLRSSGRFGDVRLEQYFENDQKEQVSFKFVLDCLYQAAPPVSGSPQPPARSSGPAPSPAIVPAGAASGAPGGAPTAPAAPAAPRPARG